MQLKLSFYTLHILRTHPKSHFFPVEKCLSLTKENLSVKQESTNPASGKRHYAKKQLLEYWMTISNSLNIESNICLSLMSS